MLQPFEYKQGEVIGGRDINSRFKQIPAEWSNMKCCNKRLSRAERTWGPTGTSQTGRQSRPGGLLGTVLSCCLSFWGRQGSSFACNRKEQSEKEEGPSSICLLKKQSLSSILYQSTVLGDQISINNRYDKPIKSVAFLPVFQ